jgi:hypothetical protein
LFLILAALATLDRRVDETGGRKKTRRRRSTKQTSEGAHVDTPALPEAEPA